jgi:hypothetical protein
VIIFAQQKITGVVSVLITYLCQGANVTLKGSRHANTTNADGVFVVNASPWMHSSYLLLVLTREKIAVGANFVE